LLGTNARQHRRLVEPQARGFVHGTRVAPLETRVLFGPRNKEGATEMHPMQAAEIQIAAIDDVKRAGLVEQLVEDVDVVRAPCRSSG
jgi:hypothetical protein